jgi:hypothetical protein
MVLNILILGFSLQLLIYLLKRSQFYSTNTCPPFKASRGSKFLNSLSNQSSQKIRQEARTLPGNKKE